MQNFHNGLFRDSYKLFEKCLDIVDIRPWQSDNLRKEFINGTKFGLGMFKVRAFNLSQINLERHILLTRFFVNVIE